MDSTWTNTKKNVNDRFEQMTKELEEKWKQLPPSKELKGTAHDRFLTGLENFVQNYLKGEEELLTQHQIEVLREEIKKMWGLCCYTDPQKEEFLEYNVPVMSEELVVKHRVYLARLERLYRNNEKVFSSAKKYFDLWHHLQDLEKQLSDPNRLFTNRRALHLKNEKDLKDSKKELVRLEGELTRMAKQHEDSYGNKLSIHGETVSSWLQKFKPESLPGSTGKSREVGSIIGKKGEIVKRFREESGAKINISDGSCPERIVTVTGPTNAIFKAFTLICKKFEEWCYKFQEMQGGGGGSGIPRPPITLRLIVPASQCGSLIGKGGSKIKEIREVTGASIQVASEMLPNSTERAVTITGTSEAVTQCIYHICCVMLESPPKGATIPYRPKPQVAGPVILAGGQAYTIQGNYAVPAHAADKMGMGNSPLAGLAALGLGGLNTGTTGGLNPAALAALAGSQLRTNNQNLTQPGANQQTHEMTVPNELIGCIIGKGGTKIAEIRQISGAMIRISNCEEREGGPTDRTITITGNPDSVALAQYLINMSVELQKANLEAQNPGSNPGGAGAGGPTGGGGAGGAGGAPGGGVSPLASAIPLAQLLSKPGALNALSSLTALGGLTELLGGGGAGGGAPVRTTGVHRSSGGGAGAGGGAHKPYAPRLRSPASGQGVGQDSGKMKTERSKFAPY